MRETVKDYSDLNLNKLPDWQLGWLAGMLDGEGSILINKKYVPQIFISNTMPIAEIIQWMVGFGNTQVIVPPNPKYKTIYRWIVNPVRNIYCLLDVLSPMLLVKNRQGKLMLKYCKARLDEDYKGETVDRAWYYDEMKQLTQTGTSNETK